MKLAFAISTLSLLFATNLLAKSAMLDGVPMNCLNKANAHASKWKNHSLVAGCKSRQNPKLEYYTYCDGSGCSGFTATSLDNGQCNLSDSWSGQDDQDAINPIEWQEDCLIDADFEKQTTTPISTTLKSIKSTDNIEITGSSIYTLVDNAVKFSILEKAEAVGKQLRREYYQKSYTVENYSYKKVTLGAALSLLQKNEGEFQKLHPSEINKLEAWFEDHSVAAVVRMNLESNYMSGTGLENNFIFIPTESEEPILVLKRFYYSE